MSIFSGRFRFGTLVGTLVAGAALVTPGSALGNMALTRISSDPLSNTTSQHATEVEPDTFASGSTIVSAFQVGRFFDGGATDIGVARSTDGGASWGTPGFLPTTHNVGLVSSIPLEPNTRVVPTVFISRSTDRGRAVRGPGVDLATGGEQGGPRQELDRLRQHAQQRVPRQLLHRIRQTSVRATWST